jgi:hypothetical protein
VGGGVGTNHGLYVPLHRGALQPAWPKSGGATHTNTHQLDMMLMVSSEPEGSTGIKKSVEATEPTPPRASAVLVSSMGSNFVNSAVGSASSPSPGSPLRGGGRVQHSGRREWQGGGQ